MNLLDLRFSIKEELLINNPIMASEIAKLYPF